MSEQRASDEAQLARNSKLPWFRKERRARDYKEALSSRMLFMAGLTALFVLLDPKLVVPIGDGQTLTLGGAGFSLDIKGMVIGAIIIEGLKSIKEYWLGTSASGQKQQESLSMIAEQAAPTTAAAVAAARSEPAAPLPPVVVPVASTSDAPAATPAAQNPDTGAIPAAEVATQPPKEQKP